MSCIGADMHLTAQKAIASALLLSPALAAKDLLLSA